MKPINIFNSAKHTKELEDKLFRYENAKHEIAELLNDEAELHKRPTEYMRGLRAALDLLEGVI